MRKIIILGAGAHGRVLRHEFSQYQLDRVFMADDDPQHADVLPIEEVRLMAPGDVRLLNGIGNHPSMRGTGLVPRQVMFEDFVRRGFVFMSLNSHRIRNPDKGVQIFASAQVGPNVTVGDNTIVNMGALLTHDITIGKHCHIAPGAVICGGVTIGDGVHIGAGAVLIQGITVGNGSLIGAGVTVTRDVKYWDIVVHAGSVPA